MLTYKEHALETGSTSHAVAYVGLTWADGETTWGAGQHDGYHGGQRQGTGKRHQQSRMALAERTVLI